MIITEYMDNGSLDVFLRVSVTLDQYCIRCSFILEMNTNTRMNREQMLVYSEDSGIWISGGTP